MKNICLFLSETWHAVYFCAKAAEGRSKTKRICKWLVPKGTSIPFVCLFVCNGSIIFLWGGKEVPDMFS